MYDNENCTTGNKSNHPNHLQSKQVNISKASPLPTTELPLGSPANKGTTLWYLRGDKRVGIAIDPRATAKPHKVLATEITCFFQQGIRNISWCMFHNPHNNWAVLSSPTKPWTPRVTFIFIAHFRIPSPKKPSTLAMDLSISAWSPPGLIVSLWGVLV